MSGPSFFHDTLDISSIQLEDCHNLSASDLGFIPEKDRRLRGRILSEPVSSYENIESVDADKIGHPIQ